MIPLVVQQRLDARKSIARCEKMIKQLKSNDRHAIIKVMAVERAFLQFDFSGMSPNKIWEKIAEIRHLKIADALNSSGRLVKFAEMMPTVPGAPDAYVRPNSMPKFNNLLNVLEQFFRVEDNRLQVDQRPSANDLKRWALKAAVLDYYKGLGVRPEQMTELNVADFVGSDLTTNMLTPNKDAIYNIWLQKLDNLTRSDDKYKLSMEEYDEAIQRGAPKSGAFEKMLERYREDFMNELWRQHNEEEKEYGTNQG